MKKKNKPENRSGLVPVDNEAQIHGVIKIAVDVHLKTYVVGRQVDGSTPQPPQRMAAEKFVDWVKGQQRLAREVHICNEVDCLGFVLARKLQAIGVKVYVIAPRDWDESGSARSPGTGHRIRTSTQAAIGRKTTEMHPNRRGIPKTIPMDALALRGRQVRLVMIACSMLMLGSGCDRPQNRPSQITAEELARVLGVEAAVWESNYPAPCYARLVATIREGSRTAREEVRTPSATRHARFRILRMHDPKTNTLQQIRYSVSTGNGGGSEERFIHSVAGARLEGERSTGFETHEIKLGSGSEKMEIHFEVQTSDAPFPPLNTPGFP